jgi:hypothetical protein
MTNPIAARLDFENGCEVFRKAYQNVTVMNAQGVPVPINVVDAFKLTQSDLQLEQPIQANVNEYNFPVMVNIQSQANVIYNTEIRLNQQDTFLPQYVGLFLIPASSATDCTWRPLTWSNPAVLTNATQMQCLYNGRLNIAVNNTNYITNWQTSRHLVVPRTQQTAALGAGSPADEYDGGDTTLVPFQPQVIISGTSNMQITIKLPVAPTAVDANSRIAIKLRGIIAYNSTIVN